MPGHDEQHVVADDNRRAFVSQGEVVSQSLFDTEASPAQYRHLFVRGEQSYSATRAHTFRHTQQRAIAAAYVHEIVPRVKFDRLDDAFVNQLCNLLQVPAPQGQVVRISGALRRFAAAPGSV